MILKKNAGFSPRFLLLFLSFFYEFHLLNISYLPL